MVVPLARHLGLPTRAHWARIFEFYWAGLGPRSILYALGFTVAALPVRETLGEFWARYRREKMRWVLVLVFLLVLTRLLWFTIAIVLTVDALFVVELAERWKPHAGQFRAKAASVLLATAYLFVGVTLVVMYNDIVVASRFPTAYDSILNRADTWILWGRTVPEIAHKMFAILPAPVLKFLDFAYFQMFLVVGGALLISAFDSYGGGLRFVGSCLTAYYLALVIFYLWPTYGPYVFCNTHAATIPDYLIAYAFQVSGMPNLRAIMLRQTQYLGTGYYIAFPSLHVGLPVIAMWFMRCWRPVFWFLAAYCCLIAATLVILEWHYALDIPGGIAVAALAVAMTGGREKRAGGNSAPIF